MQLDLTALRNALASLERGLVRYRPAQQDEELRDACIQRFEYCFELSWKMVKRSLRKFIHWPFDKAAAHEFGRLFALLRRMGRPMQQVDIQIAAIALTLGNCTVVTTDTDLSAIPGLRVESWLD